MKDIDIMELDLGTLAMLCRIHDAGSLTLAAEQSGIGQSTASHKLERLRRAFGDPLFVRGARGVDPTERCTSIVARLRPMLEDLRELGSEEEYDPLADTGTYTVAGNFYERSLILPRLLKRLARRAPGIKVRLVPANAEPHRMLQDGQCDLAVTPVPQGVRKLRSEFAFRERYSCFVDPQSRLAQSVLDLDRFAAAQHLGIVYAAGWTPFWHRIIAERGLSLTYRAQIPSFGGAAELILGSDMILTAPSGLAEVLCPPLHALPAPFDCSFDVHMVWSPRSDHSARHRWLRKQVRSSLPSPIDSRN